MKSNANEAIRRILKHEGGFVNHPRDPGGATNKGVTIGTLRSLGMDLDGDGDVDVTDLKRLTTDDAVKVYKRFYWDAVQADMLPNGVDYTVADFAVNSGPRRAIQYLQRVVGVTADGHIGPKTIAAVGLMAPKDVIRQVNARRLAFMQRLKTWPTFGKGWQRRVDEVLAHSLELARGASHIVLPGPKPNPFAPFFKAIIEFIKALGGRK
ncbi:glycosyl hydrolase 108 family protein [uncultured Ruegeria sp.]|uniref:glycoside hydrolase family 108 protein n=1 Tax=uncultured Ruegeria sp. TaxID=259304 RepID=UPI002611354E|nr:glycosyl hydrolase 108 family protein [uncultured Ruegeria sp.]